MNLSTANFFGPQLVVQMWGAARGMVTRYGYETKDALYDVDVSKERGIVYRLNCIPVDEPSEIHRRIVARFSDAIAKVQS